jgi:hypothetical protein
MDTSLGPRRWEIYWKLKAGPGLPKPQLDPIFSQMRSRPWALTRIPLVVSVVMLRRRLRDNSKMEFIEPCKTSFGPVTRKDDTHRTVLGL